jgi:hypothetical protein
MGTSRRRFQCVRCRTSPLDWDFRLRCHHRRNLVDIVLDLVGPGGRDGCSVRFVHVGAVPAQPAYHTCRRAPRAALLPTGPGRCSPRAASAVFRRGTALTTLTVRAVVGAVLRESAPPGLGLDVSSNSSDDHGFGALCDQEREFCPRYVRVVSCESYGGPQAAGRPKGVQVGQDALVKSSSRWHFCCAASAVIGGRRRPAVSGA